MKWCRERDELGVGAPRRTAIEDGVDLLGGGGRLYPAAIADLCHARAALRRKAVYGVGGVDFLGAEVERAPELHSASGPVILPTKTMEGATGRCPLGSCAVQSIATWSTSRSQSTPVASTKSHIRHALRSPAGAEACEGTDRREVEIDDAAGPAGDARLRWRFERKDGHGQQNRTKGDTEEVLLRVRRLMLTVLDAVRSEGITRGRAGFGPLPQGDISWAASSFKQSSCWESTAFLS